MNNSQIATPLQAIKYALDRASDGDAADFLMRWSEGDVSKYDDLAEFCAKNPDEPEHVDAKGIVRKSHYGTGRQPIDDIREIGWGPTFAAGNVLKYIRRAAAKNGVDDIKKAKWYFEELKRLQRMAEHPAAAQRAAEQLVGLLTPDEKELLTRD